jgi:NOL1/NOP2/sun family putative RNA methylase
MPPDSIHPLPELFLERMQHLLGDEYAAFAAALEQSPVSALRVNTLKLNPGQFRTISPFVLGETVPWCDSAFTIPNSDFSFGKHPYHLAGLYYLQDPSAMSPAELLMGAPYRAQDGPVSLQPAVSKGMRVLDLAAAPGGKTTHLAALMQGEGLLVANEIKDKRVGHLAVNVERWGAGNVVITNETPERLADHFGAFFDRVLVDAPCSGEGMFRKDMGARRDWSPEMVAGCAVRQRNILRVAAKLIRPGGYLLYSTCTFAPEEDEAVVNGLLNGQTDKNGSGKFEVVELPQMDGFAPGRPDWVDANNKQAAGMEKQETKSKREGLRGAVRLFPHRVNGDGHFVCLLRRSSSTDSVTNSRMPDGETDWNNNRLASLSPAQQRLWEGFAAEVLAVDFPASRLRVRAERLYFIPDELPDFGNLRVLHPGVWLGTFKKERFEPAHPLALFLKPGQAKNVLELPAEKTGLPRRSPLQAFLSGETIPSEGTPGWTLVTVDGWPLGWGKSVQGILKNHYPKGWQIYS